MSNKLSELEAALEAMLREKTGITFEPNSEGIDRFRSIFEWLRDRKFVVLLKLDGERTGPGSRPYTFVMTGSMLTEAGRSIRIDSKSMDESICRGLIEFFAQHTDDS